MGLLQKLTGIDFLKSSFSASTTKRDWYKGVFISSSMEEVVERFVMGKPISCFSDKKEGVFHAPIYSGCSNKISYLTIEAMPSQYFMRECGGVHFCTFQLRKVQNTNNVLITTIKKDSLGEMVNSYALMLPFKKSNVSFEKQYTLIYDDWDVLICQDGYCMKGHPIPDSCVFSEEHIEYILQYGEFK